MGVGLDADTESLRRSSIPSGGAGTLSDGGFTVSTNTVSLVSNVTFPAGTGGSGTATHWGLGASSSGAGVLLYKGSISPSIVCGNGVTPQLTAGTVVTED